MVDPDVKKNKNVFPFESGGEPGPEIGIRKFICLASQPGTDPMNLPYVEYYSAILLIYPASFDLLAV